MASQTSSSKHATSAASWVVGLSTELTGGIWPPTGADLSYYLRTVVIDALNADYPDRQLSERSGSVSQESVQVVEEAEWRLGFAIRDLPTGSGHAKWLNPKAIEYVVPPCSRHGTDVLPPLQSARLCIHGLPTATAFGRRHTSQHPFEVSSTVRFQPETHARSVTVPGGLQHF